MRFNSWETCSSLKPCELDIVEMNEDGVLLIADDVSNCKSTRTACRPRTLLTLPDEKFLSVCLAMLLGDL